MITIASHLWDANEHSASFSRMYDEKWVLRLYEGYARNLSVPWRFVLFTDRQRDLPQEIQQERMKAATPSYGDCIEPFRFGVPMMICGLDTVITGPVNHLAQYCLRADAQLCLIRDPYNPTGRAGNGVVLVPAGYQHIYRNWRGENDMEWPDKQPHQFIDDLFPGQVQSYKCHIKPNGLGDTRIVYFHGADKPHEMQDEPWIRKHWLGER